MLSNRIVVGAKGFPHEIVSPKIDLHEYQESHTVALNVQNIESCYKRVPSSLLKIKVFSFNSLWIKDTPKIIAFHFHFRLLSVSSARP